MNNTRSTWMYFVYAFAALVFVVIPGLFACYFYLESHLPNIETLRDVEQQVPLRVFSQDGKLIAEFGDKRSIPVRIDQIPRPLINALLATEDQRFFEHQGVDMRGLARATLKLITTGTKSQGGSTITMQVARNYFLSSKKTYLRKANEILLAIKIDHELTKEKILELYLNKIYLGSRAYGVAAAAQVYYGKNLNELTLGEMAMIAGLPKAPSKINPLVNRTAALARRNHVLSRMFEEGYIDSQSYERAMKEPLTSSYHEKKIQVEAPYVAEMIRQGMLEHYGQDIYTKGYRVYTTVDSRLQGAANLALREAVLEYDQRHGYLGPQGNLGIPSASSLPQWEEQLSKLDSVNGLVAAAVLEVRDSSVTAMLRDGRTLAIEWDGLRWARPRRGNKIGGAPQSASDIVSVGDVIRVEELGTGRWRLAQLPEVEGAIVSLSPYDGAIRALSGGFNFTQSNFNRVTQATRQPGSSFKPFVYAAALGKGYTLASIINDAPLVVDDPSQADLWRPQNDSREFYGPTRLRVGLVKSLNLVSIRLLDAIGINYAVNFIERFGFTKEKMPHSLSLALGTIDTTPLQMTSAYAVFANGGYRVTPYLVDHIVDNDGHEIMRAKPKVACATCVQRAISKTGALSDNNDDADKDAADQDDDGVGTDSISAAEASIKALAHPDSPVPTKPQQVVNSDTTTSLAPHVLDTDIAYLMTNAMQDVIRHGTASAALSLKRNDIAGKTGTTNEQVDGWFVGFNADLVTTAWIGFDNPRSLNEYAANAALPMWIKYTARALAGKPEHKLSEPSSIVTMRIDPQNGKPITGLSTILPGGTYEKFRKSDLARNNAGDHDDPTVDDFAPEGNGVSSASISGAASTSPNVTAGSINPGTGSGSNKDTVEEIF